MFDDEYLLQCDLVLITVFHFLIVIVSIHIDIVMYIPSSCSALFYGHSGFLWSRGFCSSTHVGKCCSRLFCGRHKNVSFQWTMNAYLLGI